MSFIRQFVLVFLIIESALNVSVMADAQKSEPAPLAPAAVIGEMYYAPFPVSITLDGDLSDWAGVPWIEMERPGATASIKFALSADADNLYFAADVTDAAIIAGEHNVDFWNEDSVELYLNATGDLTIRRYEDGAAQVTIPAVNIGVHSDEIVLAGVRGSTVGAQAVVVESDGGYIVEVALPLVNDVWEIVPEHDGTLGMNVHLNAAATANRDTKLIWSLKDVADNSYQDPSLFGQLVFFEIGKEPVIMTETPEESESKLDPSITWESRDWELVWSDEFEGETGSPINTENWTAEIGGQGWGNNELEYYTDRVENASLDGEGNLAIVARKENPGEYRCHYGECEYTSARLISRGKVEFTYGRVEARIKIPRGQGIWPAFWMLGANFASVGWPRSGEIDILENIGKEPKTVHGTVHGPGYSGAQGIGGGISIEDDVANDFHVFAVDWDPEAIRWYLDGEMYFALTPSDLGGRDWVFDHDFFLLLNVAVGGNWPGYPDETTEFPQTMLVDYVRVYKLAE
jgi:beta-glucanase (GH16 family)